MAEEFQLGVEDSLQQFDADYLTRLDEGPLNNLLGDIQFELDDAKNIDTEQYQSLLEMKRAVEIELARRAWTTNSAQDHLQPFLEFDPAKDVSCRQLSPRELRQTGQDPLFGDELLKQSA